jgi:hypothetical protein
MTSWIVTKAGTLEKTRKEKAGTIRPAILALSKAG